MKLVYKGFEKTRYMFDETEMYKGAITQVKGPFQSTNMNGDPVTKIGLVMEFGDLKAEELCTNYTELTTKPIVPEMFKAYTLSNSPRANLVALLKKAELYEEFLEDLQDKIDDDGNVTDESVVEELKKLFVGKVVTVLFKTITNKQDETFSVVDDIRKIE